MTVSATPQWLQIVDKKRNSRDEAISRFSEAQDASSGTLHPDGPSNGTVDDATSQETSFDSIGDVLGAISAGTLTATELCTAYIKR
ncbi:hypothetical protein PMIN04_005101 [Paraphaeosphaeria minitans]